jgi:hypothetical protein
MLGLKNFNRADRPLSCRFVAEILGFAIDRSRLKSAAKLGRRGGAKVGEFQGICATPDGGFAARQSKTRQSASHPVLAIPNRHAVNRQEAAPSSPFNNLVEKAGGGRARS